ncbi:class I SAM-dependent methyltransferase [Streptomyces sp. NPDC006385]|uniref:class I SAM-dependent methyltransferase n=1 Tax=Streptomyces sp. NPDC006385 TaxID=3156761 RepID=UPI0033BE30E4
MNSRTPVRRHQGAASTAEYPRIPDFVEATRASYGAIAPAYADRFSDRPADSHPLDRSLRRSGSVTSHLDTLGVPVFGVGLSPRMVAPARRGHPELRFHVGSMTSPDLPEGTLGGIVALYSVIRVPDDHLPSTFAEFPRVLMPGAPVLPAFRSGAAEDRLRLTERFGQEIALDCCWRPADTVIAHLTEAGLRLSARIVREPEGGEERPRAVLLAGKPPAGPR